MMASSYSLVMALALLLCLTGAVSPLDNQDPTDHKKSLNILVVSGPLIGHLNPLLRLAKKLATKGHNVTLMLGADEEQLSNVEKRLAGHSVNLIHFHSTLFQNIIQKLEKDGHFTTLLNIATVFTEQVLDIFNKSSLGNTVDSVIGDEGMLGTLACIHSQWKVQAILFASTMPDFVNEPPPWPYPGLLLPESSDSLSFTERLIDFVERTFVKRLLSSLLLTSQRNVLHKFCPTLKQEHLSQGPGTVMPFIVPTVLGFEYSRTFMPLTSFVGPVLTDDPEPLSGYPSLQEWMGNKSERSVVYLSMGSGFPLDKKSAKFLIEGVMQTQFHLLWALRKSNQWILEGLDINYQRVFISEWTPQFSVLASAAIHSAILHGGFNGLSEALWHSVPVIGFPQTMEQSLNIGRLYHNKLGLRLDKATMDSSIIAKAIDSIDRGEYRTNLKKLKKMFKLAGGLNRVIELIEFYSEEGYTHLIPAYAKYNWNFIQFYNLDVWLFVVSILGVLLYALVKFLQCFLACCCRKSKEKLE